jgi:hypothetical protein
MGGVVLAGPERHRRFSDEQKIAIISLIVLASYGITRARHDQIAKALGRDPKEPAVS